MNLECVLVITDVFRFGQARAYFVTTMKPAPKKHSKSRRFSQNKFKSRLENGVGDGILAPIFAGKNMPRKCVARRACSAVSVHNSE
jgi:hypothetical protein